MPRRWRATNDLMIGLLLLLLLPVILLLAPPVLLWMNLTERLERCPTCGRRGKLRQADLAPEPSDPDDLMLWQHRRPPRTLYRHCTACGAHFAQPPGEALQPTTPEDWNAAVAPHECWTAGD